MIRALLVGGPADGRVVSMREPTPEYAIPTSSGPAGDAVLVVASYRQRLTADDHWVIDGEGVYRYDYQVEGE